ncbi:tetratricopeptide repeat protein [Salinimicrobium sp. CDJ15-81-2]|nr:tetratricopeptide repeat protein [Salinimicrobium nanhaiense]
MSVRTLLPLFMTVLIVGCKSDPAVQDKFADLTETERDSVATYYHEISMALYQPSEMHRKFKDTALIVKPDHVEYRQRLSYSYKKRGEHIKAMRILNEAVERDIEKNKTFALQYRAWSLLFFYRDYEGTIKDVDLINEMEPKNNYTVCHGEPCNVLKGQALYKLGRYREAITEFENVLKIEEEKGWNPTDNWHANFYMARSYSELGEFEKAEEIYQSQIAANPVFTEAYFQLGKNYSKTGKFIKATEYFNKASELLAEGNKMGEPYYEAFDEVFAYQIEEELQKIADASGRSFKD